MQVLWQDFKVLITECKKTEIADGEGQALAQTAACREHYVTHITKAPECLTGRKRSWDEVDDFLPVSGLALNLFCHEGAQCGHHQPAAPILE
jgi:hypothetical protein